MIAGGYSHPDRIRTSRLLLAGIAIFAVNLWADSGANRRRAAVSTDFPPIVFVQAPRIASATGAERFPEGSRIVLLPVGTKDKSPRILTAGFFAAADPQVD